MREIVARLSRCAIDGCRRLWMEGSAMNDSKHGCPYCVCGKVELSWSDRHVFVFLEDHARVVDAVVNLRSRPLLRSDGQRRPLRPPRILGGSVRSPRRQAPVGEARGLARSYGGNGRRGGLFLQRGAVESLEPAGPKRDVSGGTFGSFEILMWDGKVREDYIHVVVTIDGSIQLSWRYDGTLSVRKKDGSSWFRPSWFELGNAAWERL